MFKITLSFRFASGRAFAKSACATISETVGKKASASVRLDSRNKNWSSQWDANAFPAVVNDDYAEHTVGVQFHGDFDLAKELSDEICEGFKTSDVPASVRLRLEQTYTVSGVLADEDEEDDADES